LRLTFGSFLLIIFLFNNTISAVSDDGPDRLWPTLLSVEPDHRGVIARTHTHMLDLFTPLHRLHPSVTSSTASLSHSYALLHSPIRNNNNNNNNNNSYTTHTSCLVYIYCFSSFTEFLFKYLANFEFFNCFYYRIYVYIYKTCFIFRILI